MVREFHGRARSGDITSYHTPLAGTCHVATPTCKGRWETESPHVPRKMPKHGYPGHHLALQRWKAARCPLTLLEGTTISQLGFKGGKVSSPWAHRPHEQSRDSARLRAPFISASPCLQLLLTAQLANVLHAPAPSRHKILSMGRLQSPPRPGNAL